MFLQVISMVLFNSLPQEKCALQDICGEIPTAAAGVNRSGGLSTTLCVVQVTSMVLINGLQQNYYV